MGIPFSSVSFVLALDLLKFTVTALLVQNSPPKFNSAMASAYIRMRTTCDRSVKMASNGEI